MAKSNTPIFYLDKFLSKKNPYNQVRLVDGDTEKGEVVVRGYTTNDTYSIGINNDFQHLDGLSAIGNLRNTWTELRKTGIIAGSVLEGATKGLNSWVQKNTDGGWGADMLNTVAGLSSTISDKVQQIAQLDIDTADNYLYMFNGTKITVPLSFSQLMVTSSYEDPSILKELEKILNRLIGDYHTEAEGFVGVTQPPNDFKTSLDGLKGRSPKGTFSLYYGNMRFPGVVVTDVSINISKARVRISSGELVPLYLTAEYTCLPVIKYTKQLLTDWIKSATNKNDNN